MADNKITIDIEVNGKMQKATVDSKKLRNALAEVDSAQDKVTKGNDKYQKGLKGVGQQSANASKNFAKFSSGMGGFVGVYASLAAQLFAVSAAFNFLKRAGELEALKAGQIAYASSTGVAMKTLTASIQAATDAQVSFQDAAQAAAIGTAAGLTADQLTRLGSAAADVSQILGRDVTDSFNRLVRGVTKAEPELLDELGIILRLNDASEAYAEQLGKVASQLTQAEKSQAVVNDVLTQAETKYAAILEAVGRTPNEFAQLGIAFDEVQNKIKELVSLFAGPLAEVLRDTPALAGAGFALLASGPLRAMGFSFEGIAEAATESADAQLANLDALEKRERQLVSTKESNLAKLKQLATVEVTDAKSKSVILKRLAEEGQLAPIDKGNLRRALEAARNNIDEHGKVTKGIFKDRDAAVLDSFTSTLDEMDAATEQSSTRYERATVRMRSAFAGFVASVQRGVAMIMTAMSRIIFAVGMVGIAFTGYKTAVAFLRERGILESPVEEALNKQAVLAEAARERIALLAEEYQNFAKVQTVLLGDKELVGNIDVVTKGAQALGNMLSATFAKNNIKILQQDLAEANVEMAKLAQYQKDRAEFAERIADIEDPIMEAVGSGMFGIAGKGIQLFNNQLNEVSRVTREIIYDAGTATKNFLRDFGYFGGAAEKTVTSLSDKTVNTQEALENAKKGIKAFQDELSERGLEGYQLFDDFGAIIPLLEKQANNIKLTKEEQELLNQTLTTGVVRAGALSANIAAMPEAAKAAASALSQLETGLLGRSQGDITRITGETMLDLLAAQQKELTKKEEGGEGRTDIREGDLLYSEYKKYTDQVELGNRLAIEATQIKIRDLELQKEAVRNYAKISEAEGNILKKTDQRVKASTNMANILQKQQNITDLFTQENGRLSEEAQRQYDALQAQYNLEEARQKLFQEELDFLNNNKDLLEKKELLANTQKILDLQKQIFDFEQKTTKAVIDQERARAKMMLEERQLGFDTTTARNPFIDQERAAAEFQLEQAILRYSVESDLIQRQTAAAEARIQMEYDLLAAKNQQTIVEAKLQRNRMAEKDSLFSEEDIADFDKAISTLQNLNLDGQKEEMLKLTRLQGMMTEQELINAVRRAGVKLEDEQPFTRLFNAAVDSFETGLQDAFMLVFDSLTTEMDNFNDQLKELGRGVIRAIQEELTKEYLVKPLMASIGEFLNKDETTDPAEAMKTKIMEAVTDEAKGVKSQIESGADSFKTKLTEAINQASLEIKIQCCEKKPEPKAPEADAPGGSLETRTRNSIAAAEKEGVMADIKADLAKPGQPGSQNIPVGDVAGDLLKPKLDPITKQGSGTTKTTSESPNEGIGNLTKSIDDLTLETVGSVAAMGTVIAGLTGNSKAAQKLAAVTAALKAYQVVSDGIKKISDFRRDLAMQANTAALATNTAAQTAGGGGGGFLSGIASFFGFGAKNGKMGMGYATGGIARGSQGGFPAVLHGTEAVVPLPDGRSIPVEMSGGAGQQNNVTVNVAVDNQGGATSNTGGISGDQAAKLGNAISEAVKKELLNQKRPGGMLSPYGVA